MPKNAESQATRRPPTKYRITALRRNGERRVLGDYEAFVGHRAKAQAIAAWAERLGWRKLKRPSRVTGLNHDVSGWTFKIELAKTADVTITVTTENGCCSKCDQEISSTHVEDNGGEFDNDLFEGDTHDRDAEDAIEERTDAYKTAGRGVRVVHVTKKRS